jgi:predicted negative regulator of RcsB-dependent stress response
LPGTIVVQTTPTEDATVTALNKEKLEQEVQQLKEQNEPDLFEWLRTNGAILLSTLVVVIGGLIGFFRWLGDRRSEREKRAEERFQSAVTGLGNEREEAKIGAAILLRTFLRPGYEQFYTQTFDLAVAHLRLPRTPNSPEDPNAPLPLTTLRQALIVVFKEAFPLARDSLLKEQGTQFRSQSLDASGIQLDIAYLRWADLEQVRMPHASLRGAELRGANLSRADLWGADLSRVRDLEEVQSLDHTDLRRVIGLTKEQLEACKAKGAIIDEDSSVSSSQSTISPLQPSQDKSAPDQELTPDQGSMPTADTGGSTAASSKLSSES